jgi:outer membrane translocation and assembly module TamA
VLSLRIGARRLLGTFPFMEAAYIGGPDTVRGFTSRRFAGEASAWGNAELRLTLGRYRLVFPGQYGAFAFADAGRVWADGERSDRWHTGVGGGLWFAYLESKNAVTLAAARSAERTAFYVQMGFPF